MKQDKYNSTGTKSSMVKDTKKPIKIADKNKIILSDKNNKTETNHFNNVNEEIESIEEVLEYEMNNNSINLSEENSRLDKYGAKTNHSNKKKNHITKRSISEMNNLGDDNKSAPPTKRSELDQFKLIDNTIEDFTDSLDDPNSYKKPAPKTNYRNVRPGNQVYNNNYYTRQNESSKNDMLATGNNKLFPTTKDPRDPEKRKESVIEDHLNNIINNVRPFSPPFSSTIMNNGDKFGMIARKNNENVVINNSNLEEIKDGKHDGGKEDNMLEVIYDPVLNCYYHPKTNSYYELKE